MRFLTDIGPSNRSLTWLRIVDDVRTCFAGGEDRFVFKIAAFMVVTAPLNSLFKNSQFRSSIKN